MTFDTATIALIAGFVGAVFQWLATQGLKSVLTWRKAGMEERQYEDKQTVSGYEFVIAQLSDRVEKLDVELKDTRKDASDEKDKLTREHMECIRKMGVLEGRVDQLTKDLNEVIARHSKSTSEQHEANLKGIAELKARQEMQAAKIDRTDSGPMPAIQDHSP